MYEKGWGVKQDYKEATKWYRKAAVENGLAQAQYNLAYMYNNGRGVKQDYKEAVKWFRKAAEQRYAAAQYDLGLMYYYGKGVKQSYSDAVRCWRLAADGGITNAKYNLGVMFENGWNNIKKNDKEAIRWYYEAYKEGHDKAKEVLKKRGIIID